jgi:hypothetical protein
MAACPGAPIKISALPFDRTRAMEMHQVRYFLTVCEHLSLTQAAPKMPSDPAFADEGNPATRKEVRGSPISSRTIANPPYGAGQDCAALFARRLGADTARETRGQRLCVESADPVEACDHVHDCTGVADSAVHTFSQRPPRRQAGADRRNSPIGGSVPASAGARHYHASGRAMTKCAACLPSSSAP